MMAPRRGGNNHHHNGQNGLLFGNFANFDLGYNLGGVDVAPPVADIYKCSCPIECLRENVMNGLSLGADIRLDDPRDVVRVICNNDSCNVGQFMHRECFENWEQTVLTYLKSCGRARSWSERQRYQNLWTKKGYDLAFRACGCKCGRGHLKKDLDWVPSVIGQQKVEDPAEIKKKKNRNKNRGLRFVNSDANRIRIGSFSCSSSSNGSTSPPVNHDNGYSPAHTMAIANKKRTAKIDFFSDRNRNGSAGNGIFCRRLDFSAFNGLPWHKLNSYHIKMEDEGNHGNDETRCFILSTLAGMNLATVGCVLCGQVLEVYDRYPLVNGTFFLSPQQHSKFSLEVVKLEGRTHYLSTVCLFCLEGRGAGRRLTCMYCANLWDGSSLVLGTMYSYDIFAAMPCCCERLRCNNCQKQILPPHQRLKNFSDYCHAISCPHCSVTDIHFVKPLSLCYTKDLMSLHP